MTGRITPNFATESKMTGRIIPKFATEMIFQIAKLGELLTLNLSASCRGMCLNWVFWHPSQLSVPEVPTTVFPKLQPYWLKI